MLVALTFPLPMTTVLGCLLGMGCTGRYSLGCALFEAVAAAAFATVLSIAVDRIRPSLSTGGIPLGAELQVKLANATDSIPLRLSGKWLGRARMLANDLTMGAHVRGVIRPYVVLSGGLVVGVLRKDPRAISILAHEASHIHHFDQLLPGLLGLTAFESIGRLIRLAIDRPFEGLDASETFVFFLQAFGFIALMALVASKVSKYREYYADAAASIAVQNSADYAVVLQQMTGKEASKSGYFHPSSEDRLKQLLVDFTVLRRGRFWKCFLAATLAISWHQWWMARLLSEELGTHMERFAASTMTVASVGLAFEVTRRLWAPRTRASVTAIEATAVVRAEPAQGKPN